MTQERSHKFLGTAAALGSLVFFVAMNVQARYLSTVPAAEKVMYRMLIGVFGVALFVRLGYVKWGFRNIPLLSLRGTFGAVGVLFYFYAIDHTQLARATFLLFTYPAWGALFSWIFLREPFGWRRVPAMVTIYLGAWLILSGKASPDSGLVTRSGDIAGFIAGILSGAATTTIRALHRYDRTWMIFFFFCFFSAAAGGLVTATTGQYVAPSGWEWAVLVGIGLASTGAHLFFTAAFRYLDVSAVGALAMLQAPLSGLAAYLFLGESLSALTLIGGGLVLSGGVLMVLMTRARKIEVLARASGAEV